MSDLEPTDSWPTPDAETIVVPRRDDTLVGGAPPPGAPPPPGPVGPPPDRRIGAGMLLGLVAVLLVAAGIAIAWYLTHRSSGNQTTTTVVTTAPKKAVAPAKVAVPRVIGLKEPKAIARLASVGLRPKEVYKPTSKPKGIVVSQNPAEATSLAKGKQVTIVIDSGAPKVTVPELTGRSASDARAALDALGLDSTTTKVTSDKAAGTVVDQAPHAGGKLAKGSSVTLSIAKPMPKPTTTAAQQTTTAAQPTTTAPAGPTTTAAAPAQPASATMPNVVNQDEAAAVQAMGEAGILPSIVFVPSNDPLGTIEQQAKPAGTSVPFHDHVQINASSGPGKKPQATVPNVIGKSLNDAVSAMQGAHLRLIYLKFPVASKQKAGEIVQQSPLGGSSAPQNAQVLVFLAAYQQ